MQTWQPRSCLQHRLTRIGSLPVSAWCNGFGDAMEWLKAGKKVLKNAADATYSASKVVARHQEKIANATCSAVEAAGGAIESAGLVASKAGQATSVRLRKHATGSGYALVKVAAEVGALVGHGVDVAGAGVRVTGKLARRTGGAVGATTGGVVLGGASIASELVDSVAIADRDIKAIRAEIASYGAQIRAESERLEQLITHGQRERRRGELLDLLVVGGVSLAFALENPADVPIEVVRAYELAYPNLAAKESFIEVVERLGPDELPGFVSGVKGKLFELELIEHFNSGGLPEGLHADLAAGPTQPGWDIRILDDQGEVVDLLQAKATYATGYVLQALERYPAIDVVTTSEVHAQLLALGISEGVIDGGITVATLQQAVQGATDGGVEFGIGDLVPSALGLAVIGLSLLVDKDMTWTERASKLGERGARLGAASAAAKTAMVVSQAWWLALVVGLGSSWLSRKGRIRREQYEALSQAAAILRRRFPESDAGEFVTSATPI
ncbi:hypothetical protein [Luteimonas yindakuii]|uniref:hypothetical protein n=1 Tax=Luteimonas yindakuii TaxID=2565782 RepID=UPI001423FD48|nr:hypothetical protein [Luteimonas yindakuii]